MAVWTLPAILALMLIAVVSVVVVNIIRLEWLPQCPVCSSRGYKHVCDVGPPPKAGDDLLDDEGPYFEVRRCRRCRVYRINGPNGWKDLDWNNWNAEASQVIREWVSSCAEYGGDNHQDKHA